MLCGTLERRRDLLGAGQLEDAALQVERVAFLRANPPAPGWDGAFTFQTK